MRLERIYIAIGMVAFAAVAACGRSEPNRSNSPPSSVRASEQSDSEADASHTISPWPFTVGEVWLRCEDSGRVYVRTRDGRNFGVNGVATGGEPIRTIQSYYDLQPVIERGLMLCQASAGELHLVRTEIPSPPPVSEPGVSAQPSILGGTLVTLSAETMVDGQRPTITLSCDDSGPMVQLNLVRPPAVAPPTAELSADFRTDEGESVRYVIDWSGDGGVWMPDDQLNAGRQNTTLVQAVLKGHHLRMMTPPTYTFGGVIEWNLDRLGRQKEILEAQCRRFLR